MLLRITDKCRMNCTHCMADATPQGKHMTMETFEEALKFLSDKVLLNLIVGGGEPTDHPHYLEIIEKLKKVFPNTMITVVSNGMFALDSQKKFNYLSADVHYQITNDDRYYPQKIDKDLFLGWKNVTYVSRIQQLYPMGRALTNNLPGVGDGVQGPKCFNIRSFVHSIDDFKKALFAMETHFRFCTPSINIDGSISVGESSLCSTVGHVTDSNQDILNKIRNCKCDKCGYIGKMKDRYKNVIGML